MDGMIKTAAKRLLPLEVCSVGVLLPISLAFSHGLLSPRGFGIALLMLCIAIGILFVRITKNLAKQIAEQPAIALHDNTRRRILRGIWVMKASIEILAVSLPIGIANGVANRAWLPTSVGVVMNLLITYAAVQEIKRRRKRLNWPQG